MGKPKPLVVGDVVSCGIPARVGKVVGFAAGRVIVQSSLGRSDHPVEGVERSVRCAS